MPVERQMVAIFGHHRVDDDTVAYQALVEDARRKSRGRNAAMVAVSANPLLALGDQYEVAGGFDIEPSLSSGGSQGEAPMTSGCPLNG